jgi:hypothetical protein
MLSEQVADGPTYIPFHVFLRTRANLTDRCDVLFAESNFITADVNVVVVQCQIKCWDHIVCVVIVIRVLNEFQQEMRIPCVKLIRESDDIGSLSARAGLRPTSKPHLSNPRLAFPCSALIVLNISGSFSARRSIASSHPFSRRILLMRSMVEF